jgi:hypothetical protein
MVKFFFISISLAGYSIDPAAGKDTKSEVPPPAPARVQINEESMNSLSKTMNHIRNCTTYFLISPSHLFYILQKEQRGKAQLKISVQPRKHF